MLRTGRLFHLASHLALDHARRLLYRGPWRLPGPDSHRLAAVSLSLGYAIPSFSLAPELLDARGVPKLRFAGSGWPEYHP